MISRPILSRRPCPKCGNTRHSLKGRHVFCCTCHPEKGFRENNFSVQYLPILILLNILIYVILAILYPSYLGYDFIAEKGYRMFGQDNQRVLEGELLLLISSLFVHINLYHLIINMVILTIAGYRCEHQFGSNIILFYIAGGLFTSIISLLHGPAYFSTGSSGSVLVIIGATISANRHIYKFRFVTSITLSFLIFYTSVGEITNIYSHSSGIILGLLFGLIIIPSYYFTHHEIVTSFQTKIKSD